MTEARGFTKKRGNRWVAVVDLGQQECRDCPSCSPTRRFWTADGKFDACDQCGTPLGDARKERRRNWLSGFTTRREATAALNESVTKIKQGSYRPPSDITVSEFIERWLPTAKARVRTSTYESYEMNLRRHVAPRIGSMRLRDVGPDLLNDLYGDMARHDGKGNLSARTRRYVAMIVKRMLGDALRWGLIPRNPADAADPPRIRTRIKMRTWTAEELRTFLASVADDRLHAGWLLLSTTGMRRGELLGLGWDSVDLDNGRVSIVRALTATKDGPAFFDPKTDRGRRQIAIDPATAAALRRWKARQIEERLAWGPAYVDSGLVFTREDGRALDPWQFSVWFRSRVTAAGLPAIRLHDVRHSYASLALQAGVHPKVVSERLGHASIAITLDTYSHLIPAIESDAANRVAGLILGV